MENFCQHIEKLLAQHDYVVVPNLGGFVVQMQSAKLLSDHITPPLSTIGFNPLMHHADGLLAIEISRSEKISYRLAMEYIDKQVESLKSTVHSNGNEQFGNLGIFYRNEPGELFFTPAEEVNFLPQNLGLNSLYISQRNKLISNEKPKITITLPSTRIFKYASVAMLVFGLFCITPRMSDMRKSDNADIISSAFYSTSQHAAPLTTAPKTESPSIAIIPEELPNFHVIVASLQDKTTADELCEELTENNYPSAHVLAPSKIYKVAIQSFSERDKAIEFMEKLRKTNKRFETAWVYCNK